MIKRTIASTPPRDTPSSMGAGHASRRFANQRETFDEPRFISPSRGQSDFRELRRHASPNDMMTIAAILAGIAVGKLCGVEFGFFVALFIGPIVGLYLHARHAHRTG